MASYQLDNPFIAISTDTFQLQEGDTSPNKAARIRITFTNSQREALEKEFKISPYLFKARRIEIAKRLELEEKNVKVWFQNRRMKSKKEIIPNGNKITKSYKVNHLQQTKKAVILSNVILNNTTTTTSLIKGPPNVPTTFKSHAIVQAPVPVTIGNVSQIEPQQFLCAVPQSDSLQIPFNTLFQGPISHNGMVFQPPFRLHPITFTSVGQSNLMPQIHVHGVQSQHPVFPVILHQQLLPTQPQPPKNVELKIEVPLLENNDSSGSVEKPIEFQISVDMSAAVNQDPEDSINLDAYLNDLTKRANAKKIEYQEPPKVQDFPPIKTEEDDLDFNYFFNNLEKFIDPKQNDVSTEELMATTDEYSTTPLKMEVEGFDMEDFMSNLDKYASVPGLSEKNVLDAIFGNDESSAPEIDIHSLQPTLDVPTPMGNFSVGDLDRNYLLDDSLVDFKF